LSQGLQIVELYNEDGGNTIGSNTYCDDAVRIRCKEASEVG